MWISSCWSDVIADILILVMPIPMVLRLHLPLKQRIAVLGMFLLGALYTTPSALITTQLLILGSVIALSITRLVFNIQVAAVFAAHYNDETCK